MEYVNTQNLGGFEPGNEKGINVPFWINVVFQQNDVQRDQNLNNDTFVRLRITSAQRFIKNEKNPDVSILSNYNLDHYSQGYRQIKEVFRALTNDNISQPYISEDDFRSSNVGDDGNGIGHNIHVFDIRYQKNFESARPI